MVERILDSKIRAEKERQQAKEAAGGDASGTATAGRGEVAAPSTVGAGAKRSKRCGICVGCRAKACDRCKYCLDSKKNNGPNKLKQPCIKRRCRNLPGDAIDWADALLPDPRANGGGGGGGELECEYCFKMEKELCSPMVVDLSPEEAETFLKQQEAEQSGDGSGGAEGANPHRKVRFPRLSRARPGEGGGGGGGRSPRASGPVVHEVCAQSMFKARAERAQHKLRGLREQAVEEAIRLGGYQTLPLGRDRHGRFYYRFPGDSRRVFVSHPVREGKGDGLDIVVSEATGADGGGGDAKAAGIAAAQPSWRKLVPSPGGPGPAEEDLMVYENDGDLDALVAWLNESGQREGPLRAALLRAFPPASPPPPLPEAAAALEKTDHGDGLKPSAAAMVADGEGGRGGDNSAAAAAAAAAAAGADDDAAATAAGDERSSSRRAGDAASDRGVLARPSRNQELPRLLAEGGVELRVAMNPPGASNNVLVPETEVVVEFDNDGEAVE
ncbi:unnamed protein product, partial [Ectocarpus sp. 12 AP-2014]